MLSSQNLFSDELQWVVEIRRVLEDNMEDYDDLPVSISDVPKPLLCSNPEAYTPQFVALGPYHHHRQDLHEMERYKVFAAKRTQNQLQISDFQCLIDLFSKLEISIRAHYHRYLNIKGETLAWMMALDATFLLDFLQIYTFDEDKTLRRIPSRISHLVDPTRRKSAHDMLLRDLVMLENQIPLFLLRKTLEVQCSSSKVADEVLTRKLIGFLNEVCPLRMVESSRGIEISQHSHLLELLYCVVVPRLEELTEAIQESNHDEHPRKNYGSIRRLFDVIRNFILRLIKCLLKIPWKILVHIPALVIIKHPMGHLFSQMNTNNSRPKDETLCPLLDEITIPSVTELKSAGIRFFPTDGNLSTIKFDMKSATFHLPPIDLDVNSEVVLRNLVAYETSIVSGPLIFTRYVELMNGIIDTEEDARFLREGRVVSNRLKSDREVSELWNGMSRSVRLSRAAAIDKVIEDVNKYYNSRWRVKVGRVLKGMAGSWEPLRVVAVIMFLLLMSFQAFCAVYGCARGSKIRKAPIGVHLNEVIAGQ